MSKFLIKPKIKSKDLLRKKIAIDENRKKISIPVITEKPITLFLNNQEIVTMMTVGDYPKLLAIGYLFNQGMITSYKEINKIEYHEDITTIVVRTIKKNNF